MLLKVSDGDGGWVLFDKVERAHLIAKGKTVNNPNELNDLGGSGALNLISKECFHQNGSVSVGIIEFVRDGETPRKVLFTNIVYVCNDQGDTLDRHSAENRSTKRR